MLTSGMLLVDKPAGMTSHDVIDRVRRITGERTVGHAGTLDPFATGLLLVAVGRSATKELNNFVGLDKVYEAEILLGKNSTTFDPEGEITDAPCPTITKSAVDAAVTSLTGPINQIPPMHSAIKIDGQKLYDLARQGITVDRPPRAVTVFSFTILSTLPADGITLPCTLSARIHCGSGTYIRALARDLGEALGTGGYLTALRRTKIGPYSIREAVKLTELSPQNWIDVCKPCVLRSTV